VNANRIAILGLKGHGKDTAAQCLEQLGYENIKFAGPLKEMLYTLYQQIGFMRGQAAQRIDGDLKEEVCPHLKVTPRWAMQSLGTEWGRVEIHPDIWLNLAVERIRMHDKVVVTDCRFDNEFKRLQANRFLTIRVERPELMAQATDLHASETRILDHKVDCVVYNDGTIDDLHRKILEIREDAAR